MTEMKRPKKFTKSVLSIQAPSIILSAETPLAFPASLDLGISLSGGTSGSNAERTSSRDGHTDGLCW